MPARRKKSPGGQKGNQNARTHGFYSQALDEVEKIDFELAEGVDGIDDEIALLRVKIKSVLDHDPENVLLLMKAASTLSRLVTARYKMTGGERKKLKEAIGNVLREIAVPLGIGIGSGIAR